MKLKIIGGSVAGYSASGEHEDTDRPLKPCPFCGSEDVTLGNTHTPHYRAQCEDCSAEGPDGWDYIPEEFQALIPKMPKKRMTKSLTMRIHKSAFEAAIDAWNNRFIDGSGPRDRPAP